MRWLFAGFSFFFSIVSALCFYAHSQSSGGSALLEALEPLLEAQLSQLDKDIDALVFRAEEDAALVDAQIKKKARTISAGAASTGLLAANLGGKFLRASDASYLPELESALARARDSGAKMRIHGEGEKYYLFMNVSSRGQEVSLAYDPLVIGRYLFSGAEPRVWVTSRNGQVLYSSQAKFIGDRMQNLKPVALGIEKASTDGAFSFSGRYLGIDGKEYLGAWTFSRRWDLFFGVETQGAALAAEQGFAGRLVFGWGAAVLSLMFLALFFVTRERKAHATEEFFDKDRLSPEALAYLDQARKSAEEAFEHARTQEIIAKEAGRQRASVAQNLRALEWENSVLHEFQDRVMPACTGKQVWSLLAQLMVDKSPGLIAVIYRYSPSSFSLVPESIFTAVDLADNAAAYLGDARIFIGNPRFLDDLVNTEAFSRWNGARLKHMPMDDISFRVLPLSRPAGFRGVLLLLHDTGMNQNGELEGVFELFESLAAKVSSFCDTQTQLLQFQHEKSSEGRPVAGTPNDPRNQLREH